VRASVCDSGMATGYRNKWSFQSLGKEDKERKSAPVGAAPATTGVVAFVQSLGLSNLKLIGIAAVSVLVVVGTSVGIAGAAGAFDSGPGPPSPPANPPTPPPASVAAAAAAAAANPPTPPATTPAAAAAAAAAACIEGGNDSCMWVARDFTDDGQPIFYEDLYDTNGYRITSDTGELQLWGNQQCDESGGNSIWKVITDSTRVGGIETYPFVCDLKTDIGDCCNLATDFYGGPSRRRERRRQLDAYVYNASATLPTEIALPITPRMAKRILDDRAVIHVRLPQAIKQPFFLLATAVYNYTGTNPPVPNPASSGACFARAFKTQVPTCVNVITSATCGGSYVDIVGDKIGAACSWDTSAVPAACVRSNWLRYC